MSIEQELKYQAFSIKKGSIREKGGKYTCKLDYKNNLTTVSVTINGSTREEVEENITAFVKTL